MPNMTVQELGALALALFVLLGGVAMMLAIAVNLKKLLDRPIAEGEQPVKKADLDHHIERLNTRLDSLAGKQDSMAAQHEELEGYTKQSVHELRNSLQQIALKMEVNSGTQKAQLARITTLLESMAPAGAAATAAAGAIAAAKAALPAAPGDDN